MTTPLQNLTTANYPGGTQDFDPSKANALTDAQLGQIQALVSGALTNAQALAGTSLSDVEGAVRVLSDSANAGTRLRWFTPIGFSAPVWCWDIYPQTQYQG